MGWRSSVPALLGSPISQIQAIDRKLLTAEDAENGAEIAEQSMDCGFSPPGIHQRKFKHLLPTARALEPSFVESTSNFGESCARSRALACPQPGIALASFGI